jgi:hypothetical protein
MQCGCLYSGKAHALEAPCIDIRMYELFCAQFHLRHPGSKSVPKIPKWNKLKKENLVKCADLRTIVHVQ